MAAERHVVLAVLLIALAAACGDQKPVAAVATLGGEDADAADDLTSGDATDLPDAATADTATDDVAPDAGTDATIGEDADAAPDALDTADNADVGDAQDVADVADAVDAQDVADVADAVDAATEIAGTDAAGPDNGTDAEAPDVGADVAEGTDAAAVDTQDAGTDAATGCKSAGDCPAAGDACHVAVCNLDGSCGFGNAADGKVCTNAGSCAGAGTCATGVCVTAQGPLTAANVSTVAGSGLAGAQDGAPASASFNQPYGLAHLSDGGMVVTDLDGNRVRQIKADGTVSTLAGTGSAGSADGPAASATFNQPKGIAVAANGDIFIVDQANHRIRRLSGGVVTTFAGATAGFKDGIGTGALFNNPVDLQFAPDGTLWVADQTNNRIRRILPDGTVTTVIGNGTAGTVDGPVGNSQVNAPQRLAVAADRTLYFMDGGAFRLRKLSPDGTTVSTVTGTTSGYVDGPTATAKLGATGGIALVGQAIVLSDRDANRIRVVAPDGTVGTLAGSGATSYLDGAPSSATFGYLNGLATDKGGNVWIADGNNNRIRKLTFTFPTCNDNNPCTTDTCASNACTFTQLAAGTSCDDGTPCTTGDVCTGAGACVGAAKDCDDKNVCTADYCNPLTVGCSHIAIANWATCDDGSACTSGDTCFYGSCMASPVGTVGTIAGSGTAGYVDGPGTSAQFSVPDGIGELSDGSLLVADGGNHRIRKILADGTVTTFAGSGTAGGQDGAAASAQFNKPHNVLIAADDTVYVSEQNGHRIRKIAGGIVSTLAGGGLAGFADGNGANALFNNPVFIVLDPAGNIVVPDYGNNAIRKVTPSGSVTTLIGSGAGYLDGPANLAKLQGPTGLAYDPAGNLYISEIGNHRIRRLDAAGNVTTVFGNGTAAFNEGVGANGSLNWPYDLAWHPAGFLIVDDTYNNRVRAIWPDGTNAVVAGNGTFGYIDGPGASAEFSQHEGLLLRRDGTLAIADTHGNRIRKLALNTITCKDNLACTADACNPTTGACVFTPIAAGGACNDGNPCTSPDFCSAQSECTGAAINCDDGNACTADSCTGVGQACDHIPVIDGTTCGVTTACFAGVCGAMCSLNADCAPGQFCHANASPTSYCNDIVDDFSGTSTGGGGWKYLGSAYWDAGGKEAVLTPNSSGQAGAIWNQNTQAFSDIRIQFTLREGSGSSETGDGWSLILQDGTSPVIGVGGAGVGAQGIAGLAVRFNNGGPATSATLYATLSGGGTGTLLCANQIPSFNVNSDYPYTVQIVGGRLKLISSASTTWLDCDVSAVLPKSGWVGFGGGTGANTALHTVDDVTVSHPCVTGGAGTCGAPVCGDSFVNAAGEECDDGNLTNGDGCSATCKFEIDNAWGLYQRDNIWWGGTWLQPAETDFGNFKGTVADALSLGASIPPSTIYGYRAWVYNAVASKLKFSFAKDDGGSFFVNGNLIAAQPFGTDVGVDTTLPAGWSRVDLMLYNGGGPGFVTMSTLLHSLVDKMSSGPK